MMATPEIRTIPLGWVGPADEVAPRLAAIGYAGAEVQVRDPAAFDTAAFARQVRAAGLTVTGLGTGQMAADDGFFFTDPDPTVRRCAIERFGSILGLAADVGVDVSLGRARGYLRWAPDRAIGLGWFREALDALLPRAERLGVRIVLEPQNRFSTDFLTTVSETIAFIDGYRSPALVFEADVYHLALEERSIPAALVTGMRSGHLTYVQLGDSNRLAPGWGHLNWTDILATLAALGYDGWLAMEHRQEPDSERAARRSYAFVRGLLETGTS
jgi:sugar phosphate isomerase/epimerase